MATDTVFAFLGNLRACARDVPMQPTLQTPRLILRPFVPGDAARVQVLAGDFSIANTTAEIPHPYEDGMAEAWIATHEPRYAEGEEVTFAIVTKSDGQLVGAICLKLIPAAARGELGYWVGEPFWGQGYATEAAKAIIRFGFAHLGLNKISAIHMVRNPASGRVMQKAGMRHEGTLRDHVRKWEEFETMEAYGILAGENLP